MKENNIHNLKHTGQTPIICSVRKAFTFFFFSFFFHVRKQTRLPPGYNKYRISVT